MKREKTKDFCIRRRVTLGYIVAGLGLLFARSPSKTLITLGIIPIIAGLALRSWSAGYIHKSKELCQEGPYALVRHPLYLGNTLIFLGFALALSSPQHPFSTLIIWALCLVYLLTTYRWRVAFEENKLSCLFGESWENYKRSVPCFLPNLPIPKFSRINRDSHHFSWKQWFRNKEYESIAFVVTVLLVLLVFANGS